MGTRGGVGLRNNLFLISLMFLGCSSELDRCIEHNFKPEGFIDETRYEEMCAIDLFPDRDYERTDPAVCVERMKEAAAARFIESAMEDAIKLCNSQGVY